MLALFRLESDGSVALISTAGKHEEDDLEALRRVARYVLHGEKPAPSLAGTAGATKLETDLSPSFALAYIAAQPVTELQTEVLASLAELVVEGALVHEPGVGSSVPVSASDPIPAILSIGQAVHTLPTGELLSLVCEKAAAVMDAQACSLMMANANDELVIRASYGLPGDVVRTTHLNRGTGIAWHVVDSGQPMLLSESPAEQIGDLRIARRSDIQSSMCVPLRSHNGQITGVLSIRRMKPAPDFQPPDLATFTVFANQAALFIANAELYDRLQRRIQELSTINRVAAAINAALDLGFVLSQIAECLTEVIGFERCIVYLRDQRTDRLEPRVVRGFSEDDSTPQKLAEADSPVLLAASEQIVILSEGDQTSGPSRVDEDGLTGTRALIAAPIVVRRQTIGVIVADNQITGRPIEQQAHVDLLTSFTRHAGLALENSSLYEAMEQKYAELNALYDLSRTIGSAYGLDNAVALLLEAALRAVPGSSAAFALIEDSLETAVIQATRHSDPEQPIPWHVTEDARASRLLASLRDPLRLVPGTEPDAGPDWANAFGRILDLESQVLLIPLIAGETTIGVLMLSRPHAAGFGSHDIKLLSIIASNASTVIKNAAAYERRVREKVLELSALYDLSQRISTATSLDEALGSIVAIVRDLVACDECLIWTIDPETGNRDLRASFSQRETADPDARLQHDAELAGWALRERKALVLPDVRQDSRFASGALARSEVRSLMSIPLMVQDEAVGVLSVHSHSPNAYSEDQVRVLSVVASQAASIYRGLEALTALTSYTDNILTSVPAGVVTLDTQGNAVSWNRAAGEILGVAESAALGRPFDDILDGFAIAEEERSRLQSSLARVMGGGDPERGIAAKLAVSEDQHIHLALSLSQLRNREGEPLGLVIVLEDITSQVQMQEEVHRMSELAAIGQLAASIAHELRNPLSSIKGAAQFLETETTDPSTREFLGIIVEEVDGLNRIASEFLDFARPLRIEASEVRLSDVLQRQTSLLAGQFADAGIDVTVDVQPDVPPIRADQKQVEQVLLNLALNAIQAMPNGGSLQIILRLSRKYAGCVEISLADTGVGIQGDRLNKIFTPFFTTKVKGTGLGLPVVQKIIQNHQGHIGVESVEGEGSVFSVHLPVDGPAPPLLGDLPEHQPDLMERT